MRFITLLLFICCTFKKLYAQDSSFTIGPVIGVDQFLSAPSLENNLALIRPTAVLYKTGFMYGIQGTYRLNRLLIDVRLLSTKRVYQVASQYPSGSGPNGQSSLVLVEMSAHYFSFPITASYLVKTIKNIQLFIGGGIVPEWINGSFSRKSFDMLGSGRFYILEPEKPSKPFLLGGCLQITGRYDLDQRFLLQVQPAMYYFPKVDTPFAVTNNSSFRISATVSYKLSKS